MITKNKKFPPTKQFSPGEINIKQIKKTILRVNHSGELGAKYIYIGQILILNKKNKFSILKEMLEQEKKHLKYFKEELKKNNIYPSILCPLWSTLGFLMGFLSAVFGKKHAMACTVAIEETINKHYASQEKLLKKINTEHILLRKINIFRKEEMEHYNKAIIEKAKHAFGYKNYHKIIQIITHISIKIAKTI